MRTEEEIRDKIKTLEEMRKEYAELGYINSALMCNGKIELLEWVINND